jgi:RNA polymerase sigma factor (TIGR02999 family)
MHGDSTQLLRALRDGDAAASEQLLQLVYDQLHGLAQRMLGENPRATIHATELIHEAWLRLVDNEARTDYENVRHYRRVAARAMRFVLVDRARARMAKKRGGQGRAVTLDEQVVGIEPAYDDGMLAVHQGLDQLAAVDPDLAQLVELRFFGGLTMPQIAENLGVSERSAHRMWRLCRAWWLEQFGDGDVPAS